MQNPILIMVLAIGTLVVVIVVAFVQLRRHRQSQLKRGEAPGGMAGPEKHELK